MFESISICLLVGIGRSLFVFAKIFPKEEHYQKPYTSKVFESYQEWLVVPVGIVKMCSCIASKGRIALRA